MTEIFVYGIPFIFVLAVVYGSLELSEVFKNKRVKMLISLAVAAIAVVNQQVVGIINLYLPYAAILFAAVFFLRFINKSTKDAKDWPLILAGVALLVILLARQGDSFRGYFDAGPLSYENFIIITAILVLMLILYGVYKHA